MSGWYILDEQHNVVPATVDEYTRWASGPFDQTRLVAKTKAGPSEVITVFLGLDHGWDDDTVPIVFETLVFGGVYAEEMERYATWDEAVAGHARMVAKCEAAFASAFGDVA